MSEGMSEADKVSRISLGFVPIRHIVEAMLTLPDPQQTLGQAGKPIAIAISDFASRGRRIRQSFPANPNPGILTIAVQTREPHKLDCPVTATGTTTTTI